ncbi:hypothetical protein HGRIS_001066 [Hohenbuehelia grisea]|uniref:Uncharacterized protein n=1 Tax=Hohenbuehelia grisea TaxID=104357 RepID=A0ABR3JND6_9AGAR
MLLRMIALLNAPAVDRHCYLQCIRRGGFPDPEGSSTMGEPGQASATWRAVPDGVMTPFGSTLPNGGRPGSAYAAYAGIEADSDPGVDMFFDYAEDQIDVHSGIYQTWTSRPGCGTENMRSILCQVWSHRLQQTFMQKLCGTITQRSGCDSRHLHAIHLERQ